jgi:hypothetical protein
MLYKFVKRKIMKRITTVVETLPTLIVSVYDDKNFSSFNNFDCVLGTCIMALGDFLPQYVLKTNYEPGDDLRYVESYSSI